MNKRRLAVSGIIALVVVLLLVGCFAVFNEKNSEIEAELEEKQLLHFSTNASLLSKVYELNISYLQGKVSLDEYQAAEDLAGRLEELDKECEAVLSSRGSYILPWKYADAVNSLIDRYESIWSDIEAIGD